MADTSSALMAALLNNQDQIEPSPWSGAGASILQSQLPKATNNTEAILGPILQGLIGGGMYGYGKGQTNRDAFASYASNPIIASLGGDSSNIGPVANGNEYGADLLAEAYGSGEMPQGWTPQQGKADLISALITKNAIEEDEQAKAEFRNKVALAGATEEAQQEAKRKFPESEKPLVPPAAIISELADQKGIVDEATRIGTTLKTGGKSWAALRGAEMFSGLDDDGISSAISDLADKVLRSRSGAAAPFAEVQKLRKVVAGDKTVTPQEAGELLLKFANREKENAVSKIDLVNSGSLEGFKNSFNSVNIPINQTVPPGMKLQRNKITGETRLVPQ